MYSFLFFPNILLENNNKFNRLKIIYSRKMAELCTGYIDQESCTNVRETNNWCAECGKYFLPMYYRYKKIEERYNFNDLGNLDTYSPKQLTFIYTKLKKVIQLREEIMEFGLQPAKRDVGHAHRIKVLENIASEIISVLEKKYSEPVIENADSDDSESDSDNSEPELNQTEDPIKLKKIEKPPNQVVDCTEYVDNFCLDLSDAMMAKASETLAPKFGRYFLRTFLLQQKLFNSFCMHVHDIIGDKLHNKKGKTYAYSFSIQDTGHRYIKISEMLPALLNGNVMYEGDKKYKHSLNKYACNNKFDNLNQMLALYQNLPQLVPPIPIQSIIFDLKDGEESEILTLRKLPNAPEDYYRSLMKKIELIKTRGPKSIICMNNCFRTLSFSEIMPDEQLATFITLSPQLDSIRIATAKQKKADQSVNIECTEFDSVNMEHFKCLCSMSAVIRLTKSYFPQMNDETWEKYLSVCTYYSPYIFMSSV